MKQFVFIILLCATIANGQKYELGKVTLKELQEKSYPADTSAAAAILYNKAKSQFVYSNAKGFHLEHTYEFKIKIYKTQGLEWANFAVPYFVGYEDLNRDMVKFSDGVTYNLEGGKIVKTKLNGEGRFKTDINDFWNEASITMPNVKPGSIIEFKYVLKSEDLVQFPAFCFQYSIPVKYSEYVTQIPEYFVYKPIVLGLLEIKSDAKLEYGTQNFDDEYHRTVSMSYQQVKSTYTCENIPALKEEVFVDNVDNYKATIVHELERTRFPDTPVKNYADTWENVAESIYKHKRFGDELRQRKYFETQIDPLIKLAQSEEERATMIFDYVRQNMNWDGKYGYLTKKGVKQAFEDKTGNAAEINLMLVSMLNHAGISSYPVLISTQSNGVPAFPTRTDFNFVIVAATIAGGQILYDATGKNTAANILPIRDLNWTGRMIQTGGVAKEINLVPSTASKKGVNILAQLNSQGIITGKAKIQYNDYYGMRFRDGNGKLNQENYIESLENAFKGVGISNYVVENLKDVSKPLIEIYNFTSDNEVEIIGDKIYVDPLLFFSKQVNPFSEEERKLPIYFSFPSQNRYSISISVPEGYVIESLPKGVSLSTGENVGQYTFNIIGKGSVIQISAVEEINQVLVSSNFYLNIKEFYQKILEKQNEKIVLKKA